MRSDSKIPPLWTIVNWRQYIEFVWVKYVSWHKRNFIRVKCLECWLESEIESKCFFNYWCRCVRLKEKARKKHWFYSVDNPELHRFYNIFCWIKSRCKWTAWWRWQHLYFWKWIKCEWNSFEEFKNDMYESYVAHVNEYWEKNTTIDRINWDWNYCKSNCRWATCKEQSNNTKMTLRANIDWKIYITPDISSLTWVSLDMARRRLKKYLKWEIDVDKLFAKRRSSTPPAPATANS